MTIWILFCMIVFLVCVFYNLFDYEYFQIEPEEINQENRKPINRNSLVAQGQEQNQRISVIDYKPSAITMKENIDNKERVDNISQGTGNNAHRETEAEKNQSKD